MKISIQNEKIEKIKTGGAVIPVFEDENLALDRVDRLLGSMAARVLKRGDFKPTVGAVHLLYPEGRIPAERVLLAGLGKRSELTPHKLRHAAGRAASALRSLGAEHIAICAEGMPFAPEETGEALTEGSLLGLYRFTRYKTNDESVRKTVRALTLAAGGAGAREPMQRGSRTGALIAESTAMVRDLVSTPGADMTPVHVADRARQVAREFGLKIQVFDRKQIEKLGMGGLLGVSAGSEQPPRFIVLEYRNGGKDPFIALVGKTITFDSGGISLKPGEGMDKMKDDMAGGAAVLGAIRTAAALRLPLNVVAVLPAAENMPGGHALKPGDILKTMSGQTIEIINTDAEGRLILSDALSYACRYKPAVIVDIATLTGACRIALGTEAAGMLGTSDKYKQMLKQAGEKTGERVWELPLWEGYFENIKSDIADMKNVGGRDGGVITAAAILSKFVDKHPWVHLDIAATAWTEKDRPYTPKGATGTGMRLLTQFLRDLAAGTR